MKKVTAVKTSKHKGNTVMAMSSFAVGSDLNLEPERAMGSAGGMVGGSSSSSGIQVRVFLTVRRGGAMMTTAGSYLLCA